MAWINEFLRDEGGTTAVEYAVMLALLILVMIAGITSFGGGTGNLFSSIASGVETAANAGG